MWNLAAVFGGSFVLALSGAVAPGPLLAVTVAGSLRYGPAAGPLLVTGHALLEAGMVALLVAGAGDVLRGSWVFNVVAVAGGCLLVGMGVHMFTGGGAAGDEAAREGGSPVGAMRLVFSGAAASVANPYWALWWLTAGLGFLVVGLSAGILGVVAFFLGHVSADYLWYTVVSFGVGRGRNLLRGRLYRIVGRACGVMLVAFGGWFLLLGCGAGGVPRVFG